MLHSCPGRITSVVLAICNSGPRAKLTFVISKCYPVYLNSSWTSCINHLKLILILKTEGHLVNNDRESEER